MNLAGRSTVIAGLEALRPKEWWPRWCAATGAGARRGTTGREPGDLGEALRRFFDGGDNHTEILAYDGLAHANGGQLPRCEEDPP